ncbi:MAG: transcription termination/antitermination factor NusG [Dehalococcoidia bacterium]|nr:MAG: transcription termination/antitermination factor NusG [Dehalococcoidia bacterium]
MIPDGHWYLVYTYSGREQKAKRNLDQRIKSMDVEDKVFEVVIPTVKEIEIKGGQRRSVSKKLFPGYIMVKMNLDEESWDMVRNTPGVVGFASGGSKPSPLTREEADRILERMQEAPAEVSIGFRKGESVRITTGPFVDFIGKVDEMNLDKGKVVVLLNLFGRQTSVELDALDLERL